MYLLFSPSKELAHGNSIFHLKTRKEENYLATKFMYTVECNWVYRKWLLSGQWEWTLSGDSRCSWSRGFSEKKLPQINPSHSVKFEMGLFTKRDVKWTYITVIFGNYKITAHSLLLLVNQGWSDVIKLSQVKLSSGWTTCFSLLHSLVSSSNWFT